MATKKVDDPARRTSVLSHKELYSLLNHLQAQREYIVNQSLTAPEMAAMLSEKCGFPVTINNVKNAANIAEIPLVFRMEKRRDGTKKPSSYDRLSAKIAALEGQVKELERVTAKLLATQAINTDAVQRISRDLGIKDATTFSVVKAG